MEVTILGCGSSSGVPVIGCKCPVCTNIKPKNIRSRSSILLKKKNTSIIIDTGPDFRQQYLKTKISHIDGVVYTHAHADHIMGIDDLKSLGRKGAPVDVYFDYKTAEVVSARFSYLFESRLVRPNFKVLIARKNIFYDRKCFQIGDITLFPMYQSHGKSSYSYGFRVEDLAYSVDFSELSEQNLTDLQGVAVWIVDCIGVGKYLTHSNLKQTLEYISELKVKRAILTHLSHEIDYYSLSKKLPDNVEIAYDNMHIKLR